MDATVIDYRIAAAKKRAEKAEGSGLTDEEKAALAALLGGGGTTTAPPTGPSVPTNPPNYNPFNPQ